MVGGEADDRMSMILARQALKQKNKSTFTFKIFAFTAWEGTINNQQSVNPWFIKSINLLFTVLGKNNLTIYKTFLNTLNL